MRYFWYPMLVVIVFSSCSDSDKGRKRSRPNKSREAFAIMRNDDCFTCHGIEDDGAGPSYRRIAEKYENDNETVRQLAKKVLEGGGGVWGSGQMIRHDFIKPFEAEKIIRWVLSLDSDSVKQKTASAAASQLRQDDNGIIKVRQGPEDAAAAPTGEGMSVGSLDHVYFPEPGALKEHVEGALELSTTLDISLHGKYFFYLQKGPYARMYMDGNQVISERPDDREIMLELEPGKYNLSIMVDPSQAEGPLGLYWLPRGERYYTLFKGTP